MSSVSQMKRNFERQAAAADRQGGPPPLPGRNPAARPPVDPPPSHHRQSTADRHLPPVPPPNHPPHAAPMASAYQPPPLPPSHPSSHQAPHPIPSSHPPALPSSHPPALPPSHPPALPSSHPPALPPSHPPAIPSSHPPALPPSLPPSHHSSPSQPPSAVTSPAPAAFSTSVAAPSVSQGDRFGACLQASYEAISKRHDEELKALESLRSHIHRRSRADKDYAETLAKINMSCRRSADFGSNPSRIVQAWLSFIEMSETVQGQVSIAAAQMSKTLLQSVDQLIRDKRGAKKVCDDERLRLDADFTGSCKEVQDLRREYQKHLRSTERMKNGLQALIQKQSKPADIDRGRNKFVHAAKKLHMCHNDYALSLINANIHQDYYRNTLLPYTLDTLQQRMEMQICEWKNAMTEYGKVLDMTRLYEEQFQKLWETLGHVDQDEEYVQFIHENTKEQPTVELFEFDASLLHASCAPADVQAGHVVVNNLTNQALRDKLQKLENDIAEHEKEMTQRNQELEDLSASTDSDNTPSSPRAATSIPKHIQMADLKGGLYHLEYKRNRKYQQTELINAGLQQLPEDQSAPLFDQLGEGVDESALTVSMATDSGGGGRGGKKNKMETLRKGFKSLFSGAGKSRAKSSSTEQGSEMDTSIPEDGEESTCGDPPDEDDDVYDMPPELTIDEEEWYFGNIDRKEADTKCRSPGDYLVRHSARQNKYVLSVNWNGAGRHFVIQEVPDPARPGNSLYRFEDKGFPTIHDLLDYHVKSQIAVTRSSGAILTKAVSRVDKWTIRRSDIKLGRKIGRGAFGEVFEAMIISSNKRVAIKTCRSSIPDGEKHKFLQEAEILKQYEHPNIVQLIGVVAENDEVYIIMEIMPGGSFLDFLRKKGTSYAKKKLTLMCTQACAGMAYLEENNCIHRDLAARNCLVGENDIVKISDFGMSREEEGGIYTVSSGSRQIPIKWTAPEALNLGKYTSASDVWSFGILLWETFSFGSVPYPGMNNHEARDQVEAGYRMPPPAACPEPVYSVMLKCWQYDEDERPTFAELHPMLNDVCQMINN